MGDPSVEVTDENRDASQSAKAKAMEAISEGSDNDCNVFDGIVAGNLMVLCDVGNLEEAIEHLTEAILLNPTSAIMYGTRGKFFCFKNYLCYSRCSIYLIASLCFFWCL